MNERPDLKNLECVRATTGDGCVAAWGCLPFIAIGAWLAIIGLYIWLPLDIILMIAVFSIFFRAADFKINTSPKGVAIRHLFRTHFIAWPDITRADAPRDEMDGTHSLRIESDTYKFRAFVGEPEAACLRASIRQHLRKTGKMEMPLNKTAMTLWTEIPDSIPEEIDWDYRVGRGSGEPPSHFELRKTHLSQLVTGKKKANDVPVKREINPVVINWSEVTRVEWYSFEEPQYTSLIIKGPRRLKIEVPVSRKSKESAVFVLGIIRRLRELDHLGPLPFPPRLIKQSGSQSPE